MPSLVLSYDDDFVTRTPCTVRQCRHCGVLGSDYVYEYVGGDTTMAIGAFCQLRCVDRHIAQLRKTGVL